VEARLPRTKARDLKLVIEQLRQSQDFYSVWNCTLRVMEWLFLTKVWSSRRSVVVFGEVFRTENLALSIRFAAGIRLPRLLEATSILLFEQKDHRVFWALLACIAVCTYAPTQKALRNMSRSAKL
jgi:hypothetical protein